jgi:polysaccharide biosynthesis/export protein
MGGWPAVFGVLVLLVGAAAAECQQQADPADPLRPGDMVRLRIWGDTLLAGDFPVDERGQVVLPRLGGRDVREISPQALRDGVVAEYQRMLRNPSVELLTFRRVVILGAVRDPGVHHMPTGQSSLSDALALAGGVAPDGRYDRVRITRDGESVEHRLASDWRTGDIGLRSGDEVFVPERPWLTRNQAVMATVISSAVSVLVAIIFVTSS